MFQYILVPPRSEGLYSPSEKSKQILQQVKEQDDITVLDQICEHGPMLVEMTPETAKGITHLEVHSNSQSYSVPTIPQPLTPKKPDNNE